jgi:hypothetical protein
VTAPRALYVLLAVVALAAAVLSFDALRGLALVCGFSPFLAPLLPVTIDAGAGAGAVAWLGRQVGPGRAFGRALALALLAASVAGNALGHALAAYSARPHWGVVVAVSAVAPAVLGAVVHLAVLVARPGEALADGPQPKPACRPESPAAASAEPELATADAQLLARTVELVADGAGRPKVAEQLGVKDHVARRLVDEARAQLNGAAR